MLHIMSCCVACGQHRRSRLLLVQDQIGKYPAQDLTSIHFSCFQHSVGETADDRSSCPRTPVALSPSFLVGSGRIPGYQGTLPMKLYSPSTDFDRFSAMPSWMRRRLRRFGHRSGHATIDSGGRRMSTLDRAGQFIRPRVSGEDGKGSVAHGSRRPTMDMLGSHHRAY
ncbi:hypothetical protein IF2G_05485 [Cordyceps javanica]|nr:hypothetical protein IF2G_05485 [Cordyceps javanica]